MTMKKSMIAVAVAGAVGAPMSAAQAAEAYGFINVGLDNVSKDDGGANTLVFVGGNDGSTHLTDTAESRFGFRGSEDLGNGLTAGYRFEFGLGTDFGGGGAPNEDAVITTRLSNVSLSGDFGSVKVGTQWGALYEYLGWNVYRSDSNGGAAWYYATQFLNNDAYGLRVSNAINYTYGAGGYGSDPFTFTVQAMLDPDTGAGAAENDELLDATVIAAQGVFGDITVNGAAYQEADSASGASEPSLTGIGVNYTGIPDLYIGGNFTVTDVDVSGVDDFEVINVLATYDMGGGVSGMAGFGSGDSGDNDVDLSTVFLQLQRQLSSRTKVYVEVESATVDNAGVTGDDATTDAISLNMKHSF